MELVEEEEEEVTVYTERWRSGLVLADESNRKQTYIHTTDR